MPTASFTHTAHSTQPVEDVWAALQSGQTWARIGPVEDVWDPVVVDGALRSFRWRSTVGPTSYEGSAMVRPAGPGRMHLDLDAGEITGSLTADLAPDGAGTAVTVTLVVTSRGMLSTLFFPVVSEAVSSGLPGQVEEFAAAL